MLTFFTYLFFAIMIYVAWTVLRFMFGIWRQTRNLRNAFHRFNNAANSDEPTSPSERGKKFDKTYGEYVDFEEVTDANPPTSQQDADANTDDAHDFTHESQISDAEYEEIK